MKEYIPDNEMLREMGIPNAKWLAFAIILENSDEYLFSKTEVGIFSKNVYSKKPEEAMRIIKIEDALEIRDEIRETRQDAKITNLLITKNQLVVVTPPQN